MTSLNLSMAPADTSMPDWNALFYHRVMGTQQLQQAEVLFAYLSQIPRHEAAVFVDAGCGSGLLGEAILERWPSSTLVAMDISDNMLHLTHQQLHDRFAQRTQYVQGDLQDFCMPNRAHCIVSNAAMHWVPDHGRMFANLYTTLIPGGVLAAQFARRGPFFVRLHEWLQDLLDREPFASCLGALSWAAEHCMVEREARALQRAGFVDIAVTPYHCIFDFDTVEIHRRFMVEVVMRDAMQCLPTPALREELLDAVLAFTDQEVGPRMQHYESLRVVARRAAV